MQYRELEIPGLILFKPEVHNDERGFFLETWKKNIVHDVIGKNYDFVQDNSSRSNKNVLRGLHYQVNSPQGKLLRVSRGSILDVVIDLRQNSQSFKKIYYIEISEENKYMLWVPPGFAHGFCVKSSVADLHYKCTEYYDAKDELGIHPLDPQLDIPWPTTSPIISKKDLSLPMLDKIKINKFPK